MECNFNNLFKKEPPMNRRQMAPAAAGISRPALASSRHSSSTPRRQEKRTSKETPRPDVARSSPLVTSPPIITRVPGVVDLVSSAGETATQDEDDDDETDLEDFLPKTVEFDPYYGSGEEESEDDHKSQKSENLLD